MIKLTGNSLGGVISANGTPVANVTSASGFPFCKNKLFNGEVTRINQRGFDGNWATKNIWAGGNTIAQQELCYGYDMWAKASATDMVQPIEAGNFRPSTVHTISGQNMTTRQETSPASGNWNIVVPQAARNVQVEEGSVATPFEIRPNVFEVSMCQRYLFRIGNTPSQSIGLGWALDATRMAVGASLPVLMRVIPELIVVGSPSDFGVSYKATAAQCSAPPTASSNMTRAFYRLTMTVASGLTAGEGGQGLIGTGPTAAIIFSAVI